MADIIFDLPLTIINHVGLCLGKLLPLLFLDECGGLALEQIKKEEAFGAPVEAMFDFLLGFVLVHLFALSWFDDFLN